MLKQYRHKCVKRHLQTVYFQNFCLLIKIVYTEINITNAPEYDIITGKMLLDLPSVFVKNWTNNPFSTQEKQLAKGSSTNGFWMLKRFQPSGRLTFTSCPKCCMTDAINHLTNSQLQSTIFCEIVWNIIHRIKSHSEEALLE